MPTMKIHGFSHFICSVPLYSIVFMEIQIASYLQLIRYRLHLLNMLLADVQNVYDTNGIERKNEIRKFDSVEIRCGENQVHDSSVGHSINNVENNLK